ncbi:hypothetical protein M404DRAFT_992940 [Pisolithus tinctorius Marx 270]|uniref:Uncharacterized protein n=1 Tax=Pisolithus tinctorius Marx 270 TaxID=870435 RepID=A0A0C3PWS3_PISTI|nr:hypothetical protein M404DRAFT_992940 [Pisolithus tinctorius Marx 270]
MDGSLSLDQTIGRPSRSLYWTDFDSLAQERTADSDMNCCHRSDSIYTSREICKT